MCGNWQNFLQVRRERSCVEWSATLRNYKHRRIHILMHRSEFGFRSFELKTLAHRFPGKRLGLHRFSILFYATAWVTAYCSRAFARQIYKKITAKALFNYKRLGFCIDCFVFTWYIVVCLSLIIDLFQCNACAIVTCKLMQLTYLLASITTTLANVSTCLPTSGRFRPGRDFFSLVFLCFPFDSFPPSLPLDLL